MNNHDEEQIGKILRLFLIRQSRKTFRTGCPDEESLAGYLSGGISDGRKRQLDGHLADCAVCLDDIGSAYRAQQQGEHDAVPQRLLEKATALVSAKRAEPDFLEIVVNLLRNSLELVSTSGHVGFGMTAAEIRGKEKSSDSTILQVEKEVGKFQIRIEVERTEDELCQVAVTVKANGKTVADGIRLSLVSGHREQASYLARQGVAVFDRIPPGEYRLAVSEASALLGSIRLVIKEGHHDR